MRLIGPKLLTHNFLFCNFCGEEKEWEIYSILDVTTYFLKTLL